MEGFKVNPKMAQNLPCYKTGGYVSRKELKQEVNKDVSEDKQMIKKGVSQHETFLHKGEPKTELALKKGGRAKKSVGTVNKFKAGGSITNVYEAKKVSGDLDNIKKVKDIKPGKADAPNAATKRPVFAGSDVAKEKSNPAGDAVDIIKVKPTGDKKAAAKSGAKGPDAYKAGGKIKKYAPGGPILDPLAKSELMRSIEKRKRAAMLSPDMRAQLIAQQPEAAGLSSQNPMGAQGLPAAAQGIAPPPMNMNAAPTPPMPAQKRGGKVKKAC